MKSMPYEKLAKKMCLSVTNVTNRALYEKDFELPCLNCNTDVLPDYIAQYRHPNDYHRTIKTAVCFYDWDNKFDGKDGLYNAIYYNDKKLLEYFTNRFKGINFFIAPDCSVGGDIFYPENLYRQYKIRVMAIWLSLNFEAIVIPNVTYSCKTDFGFMLKGYEECSAVAFSTKGAMTSKTNRELLIEAVQYTVDNLHNLKTIVVYSVCGNEEKSRKLFSYAEDKGVTVIIPPTMMSLRNKKRKEARCENR